MDERPTQPATPTTRVTAVSKQALLQAIDALLDYDKGVVSQISKLCKYDQKAGITLVLFEHYMRESSAFSQLSDAARTYLGGAESRKSATEDAAVRFYQDPPADVLVRQEIDRYFVRNRLIGHWGFSGEWGNGVGQALTNLSSKAENMQPDQIIAEMKNIATRWHTHPSQLAQYPLGQLPDYIGETVGKAMHRLPRELRAWVDNNPDVSNEHRTQLLAKCDAYEQAVQKLETVLNMARDFGTESVAASPEQSHAQRVG